MTGYEPRFYRDWSKDKDLISFTVAVKESDLYVRATRNLSRKALKVLLKHRASLEEYIERQPAFLTSLEPLAIGPDAPLIVKTMAEAAEKAGVGPMAAVAGAIAEYVGKELLPFSREVIVENGGDIFLKTQKTRSIGIYAGESSPFTGKLALESRAQGDAAGHLHVGGHSGPFAQLRQVRCGDPALTIGGSGGCGGDGGGQPHPVGGRYPQGHRFRQGR